MYAYCGNNPINFVDFSGESFKAIAIFLGGLWTGALAEPTPAGEIVAGVITVIGAVAVVAELSNRNDETSSIVKDAVETIENIALLNNQSVYVLCDTNNIVRYVGRTNDPIRRNYEHKHDSKHLERKNYTMKVVATNLSVLEAKATEQVIISAYTLSYLDNARREIAVGNIGKYKDYMEAIVEIFGSAAEDELMNLMGR